MIHIFIVNPYAGRKPFVDELRDKLESIEGIEYYLFNIRNAGYEPTLIKRVLSIFKGEQLRFYCCGGSGTFRNMLNGFDNFANVEIAFYPCGLTNDFLKVFGEKEKLFHDVEKLINGEIMQVDYIKSNHGVAINTISTGLDSYSQSRMEDYRVLSLVNDQLPYNVSLVSAVLFSGNNEFKIVMDGEEFEENFTEVVWSNGHVLGGMIYFDHNTNVQDGKGLFTCVKACRGYKRLRTLYALITKKFNLGVPYLMRSQGTKIHISKSDGSPFIVNYDGELLEPVTEIDAVLVKQGLNLVVPKGVRL